MLWERRRFASLDHVVLGSGFGDLIPGLSHVPTRAESRALRRAELQKLQDQRLAS